MTNEETSDQMGNCTALPEPARGDRPANTATKNGVGVPAMLTVDTADDRIRARIQQWRWAVLLLVLSAAGLLTLFWNTVAFMVGTWLGDRSYGHGILILPVALFLVWRQRDRLLEFTPRTEPWGLLVLAGAVLLWRVAAAADVQVLQQVAVIAMLQSLVLTLLGRRVTRQILFPLAFLYFAVPFGNFLVPALQQVTADLSVFMLKWSGVPVFRDYLYLYIPSGSFVVAETCSGIRFLISTIVLGTLLAHVLFSSWWRRLVVVVLSVVIPILANGVRAYGIVMIAHLTDYQVAVGYDHVFYGWFFFSVVTLLLIIGATFALREPTRHPASASASRVDPGLGAGARPFSGARAGLTTVAALTIMALGPAADRLNDPAGRSVVAVDFPAWNVEGAWEPSASSATDWRPVFRGTDAEVLQTFSDGERTVDLFVAGYAFQRQGSEVVNEMNRFTDETRWRRVGVGTASARVDGQDVGVLAERIASTDRKRLIWYWYWVDGRFTASKIEAKLLQARARLMFENPAAAVIAVTADYQEGPSEAAAALQAFLDHVASFTVPLDVFARKANDGAGLASSADRS